jgi:hypothetical protein
MRRILGVETKLLYSEYGSNHNYSYEILQASLLDDE